jgi:hypothetical protein
MADKPTAAFVLSLIGGIFILIGGLVTIAVGSFIGGLGFGFGGAAIAAFGAVGLICGLLTILGAVWINSGEQGKVRNGSIMVLIFSILSLIFAATGGFFIGFLLGLIGAILGLTWKPSMPETTAPPPPVPP